MKIIELSTEHLSDAQELARAHGGQRTSEGTHISEIIRDIQNKVTHKGKRQKFSELSSEERRRMGNYTSMGWAFERVIESSLREVWSGYFSSQQTAGHDRYLKTGSLCLDGLTGTPDWLDQEDWAVVEFKATWRSSRRDIGSDFGAWVWQIKAYCKLLATHSAKLYVFFVNGDYRESGPQLKAFAMTFTQQEIDDNWQMLKQASRGLVKGG